MGPKLAKPPLYVTQPHMPPLAEFIPYLEQIWENKWLTNSGPFHERLEQAVADYLGIEHLVLFNNGTVALIAALQALEIDEGEVITTPYSFAATSHALLWNQLEPVFVDVEPGSCNLDPGRIEAAITPRTRAILPVHCYGNPCAVDEIQAIADAHDLKVIYDAAHAFGVMHRGRSLTAYGDVAMLSFHATKVFNTFEGGAIVCHSVEHKRRINLLKNFGIVDEVTVAAAGINGKMNEVQAAFGLLQLDHIEAMLARRRSIDARYREALGGMPGIRLLEWVPDALANGSYFPIFVEPDFPLSRDGLYDHLREHGVHGRRYFYPLISDMPMYRQRPSADRANLPVAARLADEVLCLPIHPDLPAEDQAMVIDLIAGCR